MLPRRTGVRLGSCLALLAASGALAQPPLVLTPKSVVEQFFELARNRQYAELNRLCTDSEGRLPGPAELASQEAQSFFFFVKLLYPATEFTLDRNALVVTDDTATVPLKKTLRETYRVAVVREHARWSIDLARTLLRPLGRTDSPEALLAEFETRLKGGQLLPMVMLLSREIIKQFDMDELFERVGDENLDLLGRLLILLTVTPETQIEIGEPETAADFAVVPVTKTVPFEGQLVLRRGEEGWRIDLVASMVQSGALPPKVQEAFAQRAVQTQCMNNLRQVSLALHVYADDNDGRLPEARTWADQLLPYLGGDRNLLRCPAHPEAECGFAFRAQYGGKGLAEIEDPGKVILLVESTTEAWNAVSEGDDLAARHNAGLLAGFADGHVEWMTLDMARERLGLAAVEGAVAAMPDPNAFEDYVAAANLATKAGGSKEAYKEKTPLEKQQAVVEACAPALARLRQGFRHEFRNPPVRAFDQPLPQLSEFRELARVLLVEGRLAEREGRLGDAANTYLDMLRLGSDVPRGGGLIHRLVGMAIQSLALEPLARRIPQLPQPVVEQSLRRLLALDATAHPYWETMAEELRGVRASMLKFAGEPDQLAQLVGEGEPVVAGLMPPLEQSVPVIEQHFKAAIAQLKRPIYEREPVPLPEDRFARMVLPATDRAASRVATQEAQWKLLLTTMAIRLYELKEGNLPRALEALAPAYLPEVPLDPLHPGPLGYQRTEGGYRLYSFGLDGDDDGGRALTRRRVADANADGDITLLAPDGNN